jgi:hypothetical protein
MLLGLMRCGGSLGQLILEVLVDVADKGLVAFDFEQPVGQVDAELGIRHGGHGDSAVGGEK